MANVLGKSLDARQLAAAKATIYVCPGAPTIAAYAKLMIVHNKGGSAETVIVHFKKSGGTSKIIRKRILQAGETFDIIDPRMALSMSPADEIEAETTTAATVDSTLTGAEET